MLEVDGGSIAAEWSTLVDPQTPIPPAIQALTGITDAMVAGAPRFAELAEGLHERLAGRVFVAHNARFDYGFLRQEFGRAGLEFEAKTLCTVKLSRRLYREYPRHNLDSVIARHGLRCDSRHRALGDARAVWEFLRAAAEERGTDALAEAALDLARMPSLPAHLERAAIDAIPEAPGVYLLYGEQGALLYVGKSLAMRSRVLSHFAADQRSPRARELARDVRTIEWQRSCGELGALLAEAALVKRLRPAFNRMLRAPEAPCGFALEGARLRIERLEDCDAQGRERLHGLFRSRRSALAALRGLADAERLCLQSLGFGEGAVRRGACFRHQIRRCAGLCAGRESVQAHQARLAAALARLETLRWPWRGPIGVVETDAARAATEVHVIDRWCWLGSARSDAEVAQLVESGARPRFDLDHYRLLSRHLGKGRARVVELRRCT